MGSGRFDGDSMSEMFASQGILLPDADAVGGRTDDDVLSLRKMRVPVERKLAYCMKLSYIRRLVYLLALLISISCSFRIVTAHSQRTEPFCMVLFLCVWKRPLLTDFVLSHYSSLSKSLTPQGIQLEIFLVGSENTTASIAEKYNTGFAIHPNSPLGAKHDEGLRSLRAHYEALILNRQRARLPNAVMVIGSDDVINSAFFTHVHELMTARVHRKHVVGLRDIFFLDLKGPALVYTRGYRSFINPVAGTLGCGRVFSWAVLDALDWRLWDVDRERGLDQSAVRRLLRRVPMIGEVAVAVVGREKGVVAVDVKTDGFADGVNIWRFEEVVRAVGRKGRLFEVVEEDFRVVVGDAFGKPFFRGLLELRERMGRFESE